MMIDEKKKKELRRSHSNLFSLNQEMSADSSCHVEQNSLDRYSTGPIEARERRCSKSTIALAMDPKCF